MFQRGLAILLSTCILAGGIGDIGYTMSLQAGAQESVVMHNAPQAEDSLGSLSEDTIEEPTETDEKEPEEDRNGENGGNMDGDSSEAGDGEDDGNIDDDSDGADEAEDDADTDGDSADTDGDSGEAEDDADTDGDSGEAEDDADTDGDSGEAEDGADTDGDSGEAEDGADVESNSSEGSVTEEEAGEAANEDDTIPAEKAVYAADAGVNAPELMVVWNSEGDYTLQGDTYQLHILLTPFYTGAGVDLALRKADGTPISGGDSADIYDICLRYAYTESYGSTYRGSVTKRVSSYGAYKARFERDSIIDGGHFLIEDVQIQDQDGNVLAKLREGGTAIDIYTKAMEQTGILSEVTADDASITVRAELKSGNRGRIRYRRRDEAAWNYYPEDIVYHTLKPVTFATEPDTEYVIELAEASSRMPVYDSVGIRTKPFAASDISVAVTDLTPSGACIRITVGKYTGDKKYLRARVSYVDAKGELCTDNRYVECSAANKIIDLSVRGLAAGMEYRDLEVELDDTDASFMEYAAWKQQVSFITPVTVLTAEQIELRVDAAVGKDGHQAVVSIALKDVAEGKYPYSILWRVAGRQDWNKIIGINGTLKADSGYTDERTLTSLLENTEYEVTVNVDGILKTVTFQTTLSAVSADVKVEPLMAGVRVKAALTGEAVPGVNYFVFVYHHDKVHDNWRKVYLSEKDGTGSSILLPADGQEAEAVFIASNPRPNAMNDWKVEIRDDSKVDLDGIASKVICERYFSLQAVEQHFTLEAVEIGQYDARIKATLLEKDESIRESSCVAYLQRREKGTEQWNVDRSYCSYREDGKGGRLSGLEDNTEYEVRLAKEDYPDDILAQTSFRTLEDVRYVSVSASHCQYRSAQINTYFKMGAEEYGIVNLIYVYYREKGTSDWKPWQQYRETDAKVRTGLLEDLMPGTTYEVLAELKNLENAEAGKGVFRKAETEFTTASIDHILEAERETEETAVTFKLRLKKPSGELESRAKAEITLTSADGGSVQTGTAYLYRDSQYEAALKISGLLPDTEYAVKAELFESENNIWIFLKEYALDKVVTRPAAIPDSLTITEQKIVLNKGKKKKLTVTAQPEAAVNHLHWVSLNETVATVDQSGTVIAQTAGEADIIVSAGDAADPVSAVCHVSVKDYGIRIRSVNANGSVRYETVPEILCRREKRTLALYNKTMKQEVEAVTWSSSNPDVARISASGYLEILCQGQFYIEVSTVDGITHKTGTINVVNDIQGFSITRPEAGNDSYLAIQTGESVYQVAAGETYRVRCVLSPAYTEQNNSSVALPVDRFIWTSDSDVDIGGRFENNDSFIMITIPEGVSGPINVTAVMRDEAYKNKSFTITLDVLQKPEIRTIPATYTWLDHSNKLADAGLPENWKWKEKDTLLYETGRKTFTAYYAEAGYYPYEAQVPVYIAKAGDISLTADGDYSAGKKAYIVQKGSPLQVRVNALAESMPSLLYEQHTLAPEAKDSGKVSVTEVEESGDGGSAYSVTAAAKGTYTVSAAVSLRKAAFEKQASGANTKAGYVLTAGPEVKTVKTSLRFVAVDSAPVKEIIFTLAKDSQERPDKVITAQNGTVETVEAIEYEITAANAGTKEKERVIALTVTARDADGNVVENPNITYAVSDKTVVKCKKVGTDRLVLTVPKGADGLAGIVATAKDELGYSARLAVRVKDYTPRVTTYAVTVNENFESSTETTLAEVVLPYDEEKKDGIERISLVESNRSASAEEVPGLTVSSYPITGSHRYGVCLYVKGRSMLKKTGSLTYYLAVTTKAYGETVYVPVRIKIETELPKVTVKQAKKVNVFYTDTMHLTSYDEVSMGLLQISSTARISSIDWLPSDGTAGASAASAEFYVSPYSFVDQQKNGMCQKNYMIRQHKPVLNSSKKPSYSAVKGILYIHLSGYSNKVVIKKPLTIQTEYKKPKLKTADYRICTALGETSDQQRIYTNAVKGSEYMVQGEPSVWKGYSGLVCADEEVSVKPTGTKVKLEYRGGKDIKTQLTLYSDYWCEPLTVPVKIKTVKSKVKLSPAAVTLNTVYPTETTQTKAVTCFYNTATGRSVKASEIRLEGMNKPAQELLDRNFLNMSYRYPSLSVSINYARAMGNGQIKPGTYKYRVTPCCGGTQLNSVVLTVKIIGEEATVRVKTKGTIDLLKLNQAGNGYNVNGYSGVTVKPTFHNLNSSYAVADAELLGAYKDLFRLGMHADGTQTIVPHSVGKLKAGKSYTLSVKYTIRYMDGERAEPITVTSNTFTIKPKQSRPKITHSMNRLVLYTSAKGESKAETMKLYVPHEYEKGYYAIQNVSGSLDVNKDGKADLIVKTTGISQSNGWAAVKVYILDADAVKATAKGVSYKIPVTVQCVGRDGTSRDASTAVSVVVKK